jgi:hypothetical protein
MKQITKRFALCIDNTDYEASLILSKVYRILPDARAAKDNFVRIIDESGEDYLYHKNHFVLWTSLKPCKRNCYNWKAPLDRWPTLGKSFLLVLSPLTAIH